MKQRKNKSLHLYKQRCLTGMLSCLLCIASLTAALPVQAFGQTAVQPESMEAARSEAALNSEVLLSEVSPAAYLSYILKTPLSSAEKQWLESSAAKELAATLMLRYDSAVSYEQVSVDFLDETTVCITAEIFVGEALGTEWIPETVVWEDETYPLVKDEDGKYKATFTTEGQRMISVNVRYASKLTLSLDAVNQLINAAYNKGQEIAQVYASYRQALADHEAATAAYNEYRTALQEYRAALALYNAYVSEKAVYDQRLEAYRAYLAELEAYEQAVAAYNVYLEEKAVYDEAYAEYLESINHPEIYEQKYLAYCAWLANMEKISAQLAVMDSCFVKDSQGHMLNATLNGPTVSTVVARQNELVMAGVDATDIANADVSTKALIALFNQYPKRGTDAERYDYYIRNYEEIRRNVTLLYTSLSRLYSNDSVPDILQMQGKKERYWQFVAQLYALSAALEDGLAFDKNWSISSNKITDLLEDCFILKDQNMAAPLSAYPEPMEEVVAPGSLKKPIEPTPVEKPIAPLKVSEPTPPAVVTKPVLPGVVPAPGPKPTTPTVTAVEEALYREVTSLILTERSPVTVQQAYPLSVSVQKQASAKAFVALFYDYDRVTLLNSVEADENGRFAWPQVVPERATANGLRYTFVGWMDGAGNTYQPDDNDVILNENTAFYAVYTSEKEQYTVTWDVDGHLTQDVFSYDEMPSYQGKPAKDPDETYVYTFAGWSPALTPARADVTYRALFEAHLREYTVQWIVGEETEEETYFAGELPEYPVLPALPMDGRYRYVFKEWSPQITTVTGDTVYTAVFEAIDLTGGAADAFLTETKDLITLALPESRASESILLSEAVTYAAEKQLALAISFDEITLMLDGETVATLASVPSLTLQPVMPDSGVIRIALTDGNQNPADVTFDARISIALHDGIGGRVTDARGTVISSVKEGLLAATLSAKETYSLEMGHSVVTFTSVSGDESVDGGLCVSDRLYASAGEAVILTLTPAPGFGLQNLIVRDVWGGVVPTEKLGENSYRLIMPKSRVSVSADFIRLTYKVSFVANGRTISAAVYHYGETPTVPNDPVKENDGTYSYTFTGWTPTVTAVMGDITYEATYMAVPLENHDSVEESKMGIVQLFLLGLSSFAVTCAGILVPYLLVSRKKRKATDESCENAADKHEAIPTDESATEDDMTEFEIRENPPEDEYEPGIDEMPSESNTETKETESKESEA